MCIAGCGATLYATEGKIFSPGFPISYPSNLNCKLTIQGVENSYIAIDFLYMDIEEKPTCVYDYLKVRVSCNMLQNGLQDHKILPSV